MARKLTKEDLLALKGIEVLAGSYNEALQALVEAVGKIVGEKDPEDGHSADFVYGGGYREFVRKLKSNGIVS